MKEEKLIKSLHKHVREESDIIDLSAALAQYLLPTKRDQENWLGQAESDARALNLLKYIENQIPEVPNQVRSYLTEAGLTLSGYLRRAYVIVDIIDHLVGKYAHPRDYPI